MDSVLIPWVMATTLLMFLAAYWIYQLERRVRDLQDRYHSVAQVATAMLEEPQQAALLPLTQRLDTLDQRAQKLEEGFADVARTLAHTVQGIGIVRYNAFEGVGGNQSFSLALVDLTGTGAIVTGLHNGTSVRMYAKPLTNWKSSYSLSPDEQRALGAARQHMQA